jgi:RNA polymerase sigma-70 factor (ECF subfamily)
MGSPSQHPPDRAAATPEADRAFAALYRAHAADVLRWAARLGGPRVDAEDVAQDVFLRARRRLHRWRDEGGSVRTWLYRTTVHVVQERRRRERLRRLFLRDRAAEAVPQAAPTPLESLERQRATALVYRALERLPEAQRTAFILFELEGQTGEQIAEVLGAKLTTVWVWLHRARAGFARAVRADTKELP